MAKDAMSADKWGLRMHLQENVLEAAYARIRWVFEEFRHPAVYVSGGKDSTVCLELSLIVARELDRLPLRIFWLDQEAEWEATVDMVREWMYRDEVEPYWLQVPFKIFNAASSVDPWLYAWDPARERDWVHEQDPISLKENIYGTDRFAKLLSDAAPHHFDCSISGVRAEESPGRRMGLTFTAKHKWVTWGKALKAPVFYPLFDWSYKDIWHAIATHNWRYNRIYDEMYKRGEVIRNMRVSNLHHETAVWSLFMLQEIEPQTYQRLVNRIEGIDMAGKFGAAEFWGDGELPAAFADWREYRDYLLEHTVEEPYRSAMGKIFEAHDARLPEWLMQEIGYRTHTKAILTHDWEGVTLDNWFSQPRIWKLRKKGPRQEVAAA